MQRIGYIDALRGFAMILVVFIHIELVALQIYSSTIQNIIQQFFLALFFFISGYVGSPSLLKGKVNLLPKLRWLIPVLFFGLIYTYLGLHRDIVFFITSLTKSGYWFPIALLEIYLFCIFIKRITPHKYFLCSLLGTALMMYALRVFFKIHEGLEIFGNITCISLTATYFLFFVLGLIASHYKVDFAQKASQLRTISCSILVFILVFYYQFKIRDIEGQPFGHKILTEIMESICSITAILAIYGIFCKYQDYLSRSSYIGKILVYIGQFTMDIYLLHYFFLPNIPKVGLFIISSSNVILELVGVIILSTGVIFCCLLTSKLLRKSHTLAYLLLGASKKQHL